MFWQIALTKSENLKEHVSHMHRIRKEKNFLSFSNDVFVLFSFKEVFIILLYIYVFNFSIPLLICVFSYLWKEIFHAGKAAYGKHVGIFLMVSFCSIQS